LGRDERNNPMTPTHANVEQSFGLGVAVRQRPAVGDELITIETKDFLKELKFWPSSS
jgi:hypothetical protein